MKSLFLSLSILITSILISQENSNKIGYLFDVEGNLIYHYLDGRYYAENVIKKEIDPSREYVPGCFTFPEQKQVCGLIKLRRNTHLIYFKKHIDSAEIKLTKKALHSYTVMAKEYTMELEDEVNTRQDLRSFGNWDIFYTYNEEFDGKKIEYNAVNLKTKKIYSFKGPTSANKRFRNDFTSAFQDFQMVSSIVNNKKLTFNNIESLFFLLQLEYQHKNDTNFYYNEDLEKVEKPSV